MQPEVTFVLGPHLTRTAIMATMAICENFAKRSRIALHLQFFSCEAITLRFLYAQTTLKAIVLR